MIAFVTENNLHQISGTYKTFASTSEFLFPLAPNISKTISSVLNSELTPIVLSHLSNLRNIDLSSQPWDYGKLW